MFLRSQFANPRLTGVLGRLGCLLLVVLVGCYIPFYLQSNSSGPFAGLNISGDAQMRAPESLYGLPGNSDDTAAASAGDTNEPANPPRTDPVAAYQLQRPGERLVIKNGEISLVVADTDAAVVAVTDETGRLGGYIVDQEVRISSNNAREQATITFAVPAAAFEAAMNYLRGLGQVSLDLVSGEDVTEEFIDLNARLTNLEATKVRLHGFLAETTTVRDALNVNSELAVIEGDIESLKGRLQYLENRAAFSTIRVTLSTVPPASEPSATEWQLGSTVQSAFITLKDTARRVVSAGLYYGIVLGPWLLFLGLVGLIALRWRRHHLRPASVPAAS